MSDAPAGREESARYEIRVEGVTEQGSIWFAPGAALIFVWELSLGIYLVVKGFKPSALTAPAPPPAA